MRSASADRRKATICDDDTGGHGRRRPAVAPCDFPDPGFSWRPVRSRPCGSGGWWRRWWWWRSVVPSRPWCTPQPQHPTCPAAPVCPDARCGTVSRPLDPARPGGRAIDIAFELHRARGSRGRPRAPSSPSRADRATPRRRAATTTSSCSSRSSTPTSCCSSTTAAPAARRSIDCPELQSYEGDYVRNVRTCSRQLGADNDVWGTAFAVDDMVAVLDHLDIDRVDLYGDSYGTLLRPGLRRPPPRTGPHGRARRRVPGRRPGPVVPGHRPARSPTPSAPSAGATRVRALGGDPVDAAAPAGRRAGRRSR